MISPTLLQSIADLSPHDLAWMITDNLTVLAADPPLPGYTFDDAMRDGDVIETCLHALRPQIGTTGDRHGPVQPVAGVDGGGPPWY